MMAVTDNAVLVISLGDNEVAVYGDNLLLLSAGNIALFLYANKRNKTSWFRQLHYFLSWLNAWYDVVLLLWLVIKLNL